MGFRKIHTKKPITLQQGKVTFHIYLPPEMTLLVDVSAFDGLLFAPKVNMPGTSDPNFVKTNCEELTAAPASNTKLGVSCRGDVPLDGASSLVDLSDFLAAESGRLAASSDTILQNVFESTVDNSSAKFKPSDLSTKES